MQWDQPCVLPGRHVPRLEVAGRLNLPNLTRRDLHAQRAVTSSNVMIVAMIGIPRIARRFVPALRPDGAGSNGGA